MATAGVMVQVRQMLAMASTSSLRLNRTGASKGRGNRLRYIDGRPSGEGVVELSATNLGRCFAGD
jgi:hypothetical protein